MPGFAPGQEVEVKVGGSLGKWVSGLIVLADVGCCGRKPSYMVSVGSRNINVTNSKELRAPRRTETIEGPRQRRRVVEVAQPRNPRGPLRFPKYKAWVKSKPCIFCQGSADDPHHYGPKGMAQTADDTRVVAVCRKAHDALHARRPKELCNPWVFMMEDEKHAWAAVEAHVYKMQGDHLAEYIRKHGNLR